MNEDKQKVLAELAARKAQQTEPAQMLPLEDLPDDADLPAGDQTLPDWAKIPDTIKLPDGWLVWCVRFRADLTNTPRKGERTCALWNLSEADEKLAAKRSRGDPMRVIDECTKQMIRIVDGIKADWTGAKGAGSVDIFWTEIGAKARHQLKSLYLKTHTMTPEENADFFVECIVSRTVA